MCFTIENTLRKRSNRFHEQTFVESERLSKHNQTEPCSEKFNSKLQTNQVKHPRAHTTTAVLRVHRKQIPNENPKNILKVAISQYHHSTFKYRSIVAPVERLARLGSSALVSGPEPYLPIPQSLCLKAVNDWVKAEHAKRWLAYEGGVHTKHFLSKPLERWSRELRKMDRNRIRRVVGAITGHFGLNKHLTRSISCGTDEETGLHVICECPKFHNLRRRTLGSYVVQPSDVVKLGPVVLDRFLAATLRLSGFKWWWG